VTNEWKEEPMKKLIAVLALCALAATASAEEFSGEVESLGTIVKPLCVMPNIPKVKWAADFFVLRLKGFGIDVPHCKNDQGLGEPLLDPNMEKDPGSILWVNVSMLPSKAGGVAGCLDLSLTTSVNIIQTNQWEFAGVWRTGTHVFTAGSDYKPYVKEILSDYAEAFAKAYHEAK
jgi:hypothetical protein